MNKITFSITEILEEIKVEEFVEKSGSRDIPNNITQASIFSLFFSNEIITEIANQSNIYQN